MFGRCLSFFIFLDLARLAAEESVASVPITFIVKHVLFVVLSMSDLRVTAAAQAVATSESSAPVGVAGVVVPIISSVVNTSTIPISAERQNLKCFWPIGKTKK